MGNVVIIIDDVEYEAVQADNLLGKCEGCAFYEECVNQECHCGFLGKIMDGKHFIRKRKG